MHTSLVSTAILQEHLDDPDWVVLDCQHDLLRHDLGYQAYQREHLPGARFVSMETDMAGTKTGRNGRHPLPDRAAVEAVLGRLGVRAGRQVVAYDHSGNVYAGRVWWTLRWLGHREVAVLDGGLGKWKAEGRRVTDLIPEVRPVTFVGRPDDSRRIEIEALIRDLGKPGWVLLDARSADRYRGEAETIDPVAGHIPGAWSRFWKENLNPDGTFKEPEVLRTEFRRLLGDVPPDQVVHQCGSGVTACANLLAMEVAGLPGSRLYVGSWSEWCADPARPIATGSTP